jgi:hypothetical protein
MPTPLTPPARMSILSAMPRSSGSWMTADEISAAYAVSADTLALYRQRGALPSLVRGGRVVYDVETAASIFRRRGATSSMGDASDARSFGRLGAVTLGGASPVAGAALARPAAARTRLAG